MEIERTMLFLKRLYVARRLGFSFPGTAKFVVPTSIRLFGHSTKLHAPRDDIALAEDIIDVWLDDDYGLREITRPINTVLDIGANVGVFSLWARKFFPHALIHAYEPNPAVFRFLKANFDQLTSTPIAHCEGVGDEDGRASMVFLGSSRIAQTNSQPDGDVTITGIVRAIERIGGRVDLMKLDCEGAEWSIFKNKDIFRNVEIIRMEYHLTNGRSLNDLYTAADAISFKVDRIDENQLFGIAWLSSKSAR